jgi:hypothetical protein
MARATPSKGVPDILLSEDVGEGCRLLQLDDSPFQSDSDSVGPVIGSQFGENVLDMALDGYFSQRQLRPDFLVGITGCN